MPSVVLSITFIHCYAEFCYVEYHNAECRYAECRHAECHGAVSTEPVFLIEQFSRCRKRLLQLLIIKWRTMLAVVERGREKRREREREREGGRAKERDESVRLVRRCRLFHDDFAHVLTAVYKSFSGLSWSLRTSFDVIASKDMSNFCNESSFQWIFIFSRSMWGESLKNFRAHIRPWARCSTCSISIEHVERPEISTNPIEQKLRISPEGT